ncbi:hypothetical protein ACFLYH_02275 [Candidatus Dependentiae bacterium]
MRNKNIYLTFFTILSILISFSSCVKNSQKGQGIKKDTRFDLKPFEKRLLEEEKMEKPLEIKIEKEKKVEGKRKKTMQNGTNNAELDFWVKNVTGKSIYIVCFSYIKKEHFLRWRWDKSPIYTLKNNEKIKIDIDYIPDQEHRKNVYGYVAVMDSLEEAKKATYELLDDKNKIDLDQLYKLKNKKILIGIEKYGIKGEVLSYDIVPIKNFTESYPELDFIVNNKTGKTIFVICFVYQIKENMKVWRYDKTPAIKLKNNEYGLIDVDTIAKPYDRVYMRGYLAIFDANQEDQVQKTTFELLKPKNKISLGRIASLQNKKIIIEVEKYGEIGDKIDYTVKPLKRIDFKKALKLE